MGVQKQSTQFGAEEPRLAELANTNDSDRGRRRQVHEIERASEREREREKEREKEREREREGERERKREGAREGVCVCVREKKQESARQIP